MTAIFDSDNHYAWHRNSSRIQIWDCFVATQKRPIAVKLHGNLRRISERLRVVIAEYKIVNMLFKYK